METAKQEALMALCLLGSGKKGQDLFAFASPRDEESLRKISAQFLAQEEIDQGELLEMIRRRNYLQSLSSLEEIHPGWIVEKLEGESSRVLGLVCRLLSGEKVKFLLDHLPPALKAGLPTIQESYQVSPQVLEVVRQIIEKRFPISLKPPSDSSFTFAHIAWMKEGDLKTLFWDLGQEEIRRAMQGVSPAVLRAFLIRFSPQEAKEIKTRIEMGRPVSETVKREAQKHLMMIPLEQLPSAELFLEIGYSCFSSLLTHEDLSWADFICQKLPPAEGYRLRRRIQEEVPEVGKSAEDPAIIQEKKDEILGRIKTLAGKGLIRRYWKS